MLAAMPKELSVSFVSVMVASSLRRESALDEVRDESAYSLSSCTLMIALRF